MSGAIIKKLSCCDCDIEFGMTEAMVELRKVDGKNFSCPNGHKQHYREPLNQRLKKEVTELERKLSRTRTEYSNLKDHHAHLFRRLASTKGVVTKLRNKIKDLTE